MYSVVGYRLGGVDMRECDSFTRNRSCVPALMYYAVSAFLDREEI